MEHILTAYLAQSPRTNRWYYSVRSFLNVSVKGADGKAYKCLAPKGNQDTRNIAPDAITTCILPDEFIEMTEEQVTKVFPKVAKLDTTTGQVIVK